MKRNSRDPFRSVLTPAAYFLRQASAVFAGDLWFYVVSILSIQGATYLTQFLLVRLLTPSEFGIVRSTESMLSFAVLMGSVGMPSLAVKAVAQAPSLQDKTIVLTQLIRNALFASLITTVVLRLSANFLLPADNGSALSLLAFVVPFTAAVRICANYLQSTGHMLRLVRVSLAMAVFSIAGVVIPVYFLGYLAWPNARLVTEVLIALMVIVALRRELTSGLALFSKSRMEHSLLIPGLQIMFSLVLRSAIDTLPILVMNMMSVPSADIGYFGFANLIALSVLILPGALSNLALPKYAGALLYEPAAAKEIRRRNFTLVAVTAAVISACAGILVVLLVPVFAPSYVNAIPIIELALVLAVVRALVSSHGMLLIAHNKNGFAVVANLLYLGASLSLFVVLLPLYGVAGLMIAALTLELCMLVGFVLITRRFTSVFHK